MPSRTLGHRRRDPAPAQSPERGAPVHRGSAAEVRSARIECAQAQGGGGEPACGPSPAQDHVPAHAGRARRRLRPRRRARFGDDPPRVGLRGAAPGASELRAALSPRRDPGRGTGPKPARIRPLSSDRGPLPRRSRERVGNRARLRRCTDHGAGVPGHPGGHHACVPAARLRGEAAGARTPPSEALLGRSGPGTRGEEAPRNDCAGGAGGAPRGLGPAPAAGSRRGGRPVRRPPLLGASPREPHRGGLPPPPGGEFAAIEVKSQPRYHTGMLRGLRAVAELPGMVRRVLVYGGRRSFRTEDGVDVWTTGRLQRTLAANGLWP